MDRRWRIRLTLVLAHVAACVHGTNRCLLDSDCNDGRVCAQEICVAASGPGASPACLGDACDGSLPVSVARLHPLGGLGPVSAWAWLDRADRWSFIAFADVTGDGRADLVAVERSADPRTPGTIWVAPAETTHFGAPRPAGSVWCPENDACRLADVDGDGRADLIPVRSTVGDGGWKTPMVLSSGGNPPVFEELAPVVQACLSGEVCEAGDVDGDGRADLVVFMRGASGVPGAGNVLVSRAGLSGFGDAQLWHPRFCVEEEDCHVGDIDGDGKADIIVFAKENRPGDQHLRVAFSTGTEFRELSQEVSDARLCARNDVCAVADVDGDGRYDLVVFSRGAEGAVWKLRSLGRTTAPPELWGTGVCLDRNSCQLADLQGSGRWQPVSVPLPAR